ncbi:hypothetical protein AB2B38_007720 [Balneola sp. MJW-20]|uniref:hypothetical protein n=1 Tax=Gracilimonas aurantiaca TaxID=3234185 RepID=UPI00346732EC
MNKKGLIKYFFAAVFVSVIFITEETQAQVRGTVWGSSYEDVQKTINDASEYEPLLALALEMSGTKEVNVSNRLKAYTTIQFTGGETSFVGYVFLDDRLSKIGVKFPEPNFTVEEFETIASRLTEKYGEPNSEDWTWYDETFIDMKNEYSYAIEMAHLGITYTWDTDKTYLELSTGNDGTGETSFTITYYSNELYEEYESALPDDF